MATENSRAQLILFTCLLMILAHYSLIIMMWMRISVETYTNCHLHYHIGGVHHKLGRSRPGVNNWPYGPPVVGVIPHGNDKSVIRWTVLDRPRPHGEDQYDYMSIHAVACDHKKFDGKGDPTAICDGCAKMKQRLEERFDSNFNLHNNKFNPNTRKDLLSRTGSLQDKNTQYHQRESQNARKRLAYRERQFKLLVETVGVDVKLNISGGSSMNSLDVGAAPGGWTEVLACSPFAKRVFAADAGNLDPVVAALPIAEHVQLTLRMQFPYCTRML